MHIQVHGLLVTSTVVVPFWHDATTPHLNSNLTAPFCSRESIRQGNHIFFTLLQLK